ncbi:MAG: S8 family serine peptidase [Bacteroidia bacterium]
MKKLFALLYIFSVTLYAQQDAWVYFADKPDADYYLSHPLEMLSQKALDRRAIQGIPLDDKDIPVSQGYIDAVTASQGITVMAKSKWLNALHVRGTMEAINALRSISFVASVDFADRNLNSRPGSVQTVSESNRVNKNMDVQSNFGYGNSAIQVQMLNGHLLHQNSFSGTGMTIAVLDAGFPGTDTSSLIQRARQNGQLLGGYNFVAGSDDIYTGGSHGSMVLSTMAGYADGSYVGTAPDASYYLFVTESMTYENPVEESFWVEAAERADSLGVDVINTSLGYFHFDNPGYDHTYEDINGEQSFITRGANTAFTRGMFLVTSAGNSGASLDPYVSVPGDALNTLTLGAVSATEQYANFSSIGPTFDGRVKPDVMAMGLGAYVGSTTGEIFAGNGTSFSSPITAGLVACLWQALPGLTNMQLLQLIRKSADRYTNPDAQYGYGIPDFWAAYQSGLALATATVSPVLQHPLLYPNPAQSVLNIIMPDADSNATLILYNNLGQPVYNKTLFTGNTGVDVSPLSAGVYIYRITANKAVYSGKVIKN